MSKISDGKKGREGVEHAHWVADKVVDKDEVEQFRIIQISAVLCSGSGSGERWRDWSI